MFSPAVTRRPFEGLPCRLSDWCVASHGFRRLGRPRRPTPFSGRVCAGLEHQAQPVRTLLMVELPPRRDGDSVSGGFCAGELHAAAKVWMLPAVPWLLDFPE